MAVLAERTSAHRKPVAQEQWRIHLLLEMGQAIAMEHQAAAVADRRVAWASSPMLAAMAAMVSNGGRMVLAVGLVAVVAQIPG
jgi:hypothetical protein